MRSVSQTWPSTSFASPLIRRVAKIPVDLVATREQKQRLAPLGVERPQNVGSRTKEM